MSTHDCPQCGKPAPVKSPPWAYCGACRAGFNPDYYTPKEKTMAARSPKDTPFTEEDLGKLPQWAQGKIDHLGLRPALLGNSPQGTDTPPSAEAPAESGPPVSIELQALLLRIANLAAEAAELLPPLIETAELGDED